MGASVPIYCKIRVAVERVVEIEGPTFAHAQDELQSYPGLIEIVQMSYTPYTANEGEQNG